LPVAKRESKKARKARTAEIVARLTAMYPASRCSLAHEGPYQLLLATVLSAQCTDARVNMVTPALFSRYPAPALLAAADPAEVEETIRSVNYYRTKSRALIGIGEALVDRFDGRVPATLEELVTLPGVGRKTANVVLGVAFGVADGVVVDTHVKRIARRLGLTAAADPERVETDLVELLPPAERVAFTHRVIDHGRAVCVARQPACPACALADLCPASSVPA
jgi:endonuclease III